MIASGFVSIFAALPAILGAGRPISTLGEYLIIGGAVLLVTGAVLLWALGFHKFRRGRRRHRHPPRGSTESSRSEKPRASRTASSRGGRRHRDYPRHPTLAESGGLPPLRAPRPGPKDFLPH